MWMHFGLKDYYYYDATNNTSESINRFLKRNEIFPFTLEKSVRKITKVLQRYEYMFLREISRRKPYRFSVKKAHRQKDKNMIEYCTLRDYIRQEYQDIKEYLF